MNVTKVLDMSQLYKGSNVSFELYNVMMLLFWCGILTLFCLQRRSLFHQEDLLISRTLNLGGKKDINCILLGDSAKNHQSDLIRVSASSISPFLLWSTTFCEQCYSTLCSVRTGTPYLSINLRLVHQGKWFSAQNIYGLIFVAEWNSYIKPKMT